MRIAYLCSADVLPGHAARREDAFEADAQWKALFPACRARGLELVPVAWDSEELQQTRFDAAVLGPTWDYTGRPGAFLEVLRGLERHGPVFNDAALVEWNFDKRYLRELSDKGVPTIPTLWADAGNEAVYQMAVERFGTTQLVVKAQVGAGAYGQLLLPKDADKPAPSGAVMVQPFIASVATDGEWSVIVIGGEVSHVSRKMPAKGDYRVQSLYGGSEVVGEYTPELRACVERVLAAVARDMLYARVDLVRMDDGSFALIELELIEPYLYPREGPNLGPRYAEALSVRLGLAEADGTR